VVGAEHDAPGSGCAEHSRHCTRHRILGHGCRGRGWGDAGIEKRFPGTPRLGDTVIDHERVARKPGGDTFDVAAIYTVDEHGRFEERPVVWHPERLADLDDGELARHGGHLQALPAHRRLRRAE